MSGGDFGLTFNLLYPNIPIDYEWTQQYPLNQVLNSKVEWVKQENELLSKGISDKA